MNARIYIYARLLTVNLLRFFANSQNPRNQNDQESRPAPSSYVPWFSISIFKYKYVSKRNSKQGAGLRINSKERKKETYTEREGEKGLDGHLCVKLKEGVARGAQVTSLETANATTLNIIIIIIIIIIVPLHRLSSSQRVHQTKQVHKTIENLGAVASEEGAIVLQGSVQSVGFFLEGVVRYRHSACGCGGRLLALDLRSVISIFLFFLLTRKGRRKQTKVRWKREKGGGGGGGGERPPRAMSHTNHIPFSNAETLLSSDMTISFFA